MALDPTLPRDRMVITAARWLPQRGMAGLNLVEVARAANAPRGSVYHYFPGGRDQLLREAVELAAFTGRHLIERTGTAATSASDFIDRLFSAGPAWVDPTSLTGGCPIAAALFSADIENPQLQQRLRDAMAEWHTAIDATYRRLGLPAEATAQLAACTLMAFHGAILLAKASPHAEAFELAKRMVLLTVSAVSPLRA